MSDCSNSSISTILHLLEPNAVQWKKSCLVSKWKRKGEFRVSSSAQAGKLAAESTSGSWTFEIRIRISDLQSKLHQLRMRGVCTCICVTSLLVIFLLRN